MPKAYLRKGQLYFVCPGCSTMSGYRETHSVSIDPENARQMRDGTKPCWTFNGNMDAPTLTPSVNYTGFCHFVVTDGKIAYQGDCVHKLKGQTVELPEWEKALEFPSVEEAS